MVNPSKWTNLKSNFLKFHHRNQVISGIEKARKMAYFRAFLALLSCRLSLAELRCATSGFEAVLLSFLHTRISGKESSLLQNGSEIAVYLKQSSGNTVSDSTSLAGVSATANVNENVELLSSLSSCQRLTNDNLQSLQTEVLIDASLIDCNITITRY